MQTVITPTVDLKIPFGSKTGNGGLSNFRNHNNNNSTIRTTTTSSTTPTRNTKATAI